jgi:homocysteine S-methyltransferase
MTRQVLILDGGLGTSLMLDRGIKLDENTPLWSSHLLLSDQNTLLDVQRGFGDVPVDILLTATYQVSIAGFARTSTQEFPNGIGTEKIPHFLDQAVKITEAAKHDRTKAALSIGPYGACMQPGQEYSGNYDVEHDCMQALQAWHHERLQLYASIPRAYQRLSYLAFETIPRLDEIVAMRKALYDMPDLASIPFWMCCVFPDEDLKLPCGGSVYAAVEAMLDPKHSTAVPWGIGINCTKVWKVDALLRQYESAVDDLVKSRRISTWPTLVLYPDGTDGRTWNAATKTWIPPRKAQSPKLWEQQVAELVRATEKRGDWRHIVVGGCCMAHADEIRKLRQILAA